MRKHAAVPIIFLAIALGGCGGGGSSSPAPAAAPITILQGPFPIESAVRQLVTKSSNFTASGVDAQGSTLDLAFTIAGGATRQLSVQGTAPSPNAYKTWLQTSLLKKNGVTASTAVTTVFYEDEGKGITVIAKQKDAQTTIPTEGTYFPKTANVGGQGSMYTAKVYTGNSALFPASENATWSLEAKDSNSAWLCINVTYNGFISVAGVDPTITSDCFQITSSGATIGYKGSLTKGTSPSVTFR